MGLAFENGWSLLLLEFVNKQMHLMVKLRGLRGIKNIFFNIFLNKKIS
jgi:hypothetical protein